jgi:hypothetical protein
MHRRYPGRIAEMRDEIILELVGIIKHVCFLQARRRIP